MNTRVDFSMFEALTDAGFQPGPARKFERYFDGAMEKRQDELRAEMRDLLITKSDLKAEVLLLRSELAQTENRLLKSGADQLRWMIGTVLAVSGLTVTLIKLL